jgi:hypothetical protein
VKHFLRGRMLKKAKISLLNGLHELSPQLFCGGYGSKLYSAVENAVPFETKDVTSSLSVCVLPAG